MELTQCHVPKGLHTGWLCKSLGDEDGVVALHIGEYEQLLYGGIVANVSFLARVGLSPLACCTIEERNIEEVCFIGIDEVFLFGGKFGWHKVLPDGIGVDAIVNLRFSSFAPQQLMRASLHSVCRRLSVFCNVGERDVFVFKVLSVDGYFQPFSMKGVFLDCHICCCTVGCFVNC